MRRIPLIVVVTVGLALAVGLGAAVSPFASSDPDGLEKVAQEQGFAAAERPQAVDESPLPGYAVPGVDDPRLATGLAGFAGTLGVFAVGGGLAWMLRRRTAAP
jgi:hypothetical protein